MKNSYVFFAFLFVILDCPCSFSQNYTNKRGDIRIMFYNVENLFDIYDDTLTNDDEFLPTADRHWNHNKFYDKLNKLFKVIAAVGESEPPEIVAFAEIENRFILHKLIDDTPLSKFRYTIIHKDSPDKRGIDVGLIYRPDKLVKIKEEFIQINFPGDSMHKTRDILYSSFLLKNNDTIHVFVNHWPSRYGGQLPSESSRMFVASVLKIKVDSVFQTSKQANILITGDFNDEPFNKSIKEVLQAKNPDENWLSTHLYNLSETCLKNNKTGTYKYQGEWNMLDQVIVSGNMLTSKTITCLPGSYHVYYADMLLEPDEKYLGNKPFRTYIGYRYNNGFSDHLPVYIDLYIKR